jgi:hypothetical protein
MKSITKISLIAALAAIVSTSAALADNQRLENRLSRQHNQAASKVAASKTTTVAIDTNSQGVGGTDPIKPLRFEMLSNGHGETIGAYVAVQ